MAILIRTTSHVRKLEKIKEQFVFNTNRVGHLLTSYEAIAANKRLSHIKPEYRADILRAAVVILHAALEDVVRNLLRWKFLSQNLDILAKTSLKWPPYDEETPMGREKCSIVDLMEDHSDKTVEQLLDEAIENYLGRLSFNKKDDLIKALEKLELNPQDYAEELASIEPAIKRRHKIVHEGDRSKPTALATGTIANINQDEVNNWIEGVLTFVHQILGEMKKQLPSDKLQNVVKEA